MFTRTRSLLALGVLLASALPCFSLYAQDAAALANAAQNCARARTAAVANRGPAHYVSGAIY